VPRTDNASNCSSSSFFLRFALVAREPEVAFGRRIAPLLGKVSFSMGGSLRIVSLVVNLTSRGEYPDTFFSHAWCFVSGRDAL